MSFSVLAKRNGAEPNVLNGACANVVSPAQGRIFKKRTVAGGQKGNNKFGQKEAAASSTGS